jgi:predicted TIM-barrel fold metal-dependent hydrolase
MEVNPMLIDGDSHFYEYPSLWRDHLSSADAHLALSVEADELGYSQLTFAGRHLYFVVPTFPMNPSASGEVRARRAAGLPCATDMYEHVPRDYWDIEARGELASMWGVDRSILFPQFQGMIDSLMREEVAGAHANMEAWNRWAVEVIEQTRGRLCPVGHIRLDADVQWAVRQIERLGAGGCRLAMFVPGLVGGKPPSHPDNAVVWRAFAEHGVSPIWHINPGHRYAVANIGAWESTGTGGFSPVTGMFLNLASQLALSDMIFNGVFDQHENLHVVLAELGIDWIPTFIAEMDLRDKTVAKQLGRAGSYKPPSETFKQHVTSIVSCPTDRDIRMLLDTQGEGLAYGSDYPHGCSPPEPVAHIRAEVEGTLDDKQQAAFLGGRLAALLD